MELIEFFIRLQQQFRILHWETKSYARHMAYGKIYDSLDDDIDLFVETYMGKYGRPKFTSIKIELKPMKDVKIDGFVKESIDFLIGLNKTLKENDTDLLNIRDTMLGNLNQLKYLLTLE